MEKVSLGSADSIVLYFIHKQSCYEKAATNTMKTDINKGKPRRMAKQKEIT